MCPYCDSALPSPRHATCGSSECKRLHDNAEMRRFFARYKAEHGRGYQSHMRDLHGRNEETHPRNHACERCGEPARRGSSYCSNRCATLASFARGRAFDKKRLAQRKLERSARGTRPSRVFMAGRCARCGCGFVGTWFPFAVGYCSRRCQEGDRRDRRRAREHGVDLTPGRRYEVFERDGWMCQICGAPIDPDAKAPDSLAAVIDHRIPLAKGGTHGPENWQAAHSYCNSVKRDLIPA